MLRALEDANLHVTEYCEPDGTGASFDPINHKYDRTGKRKVTDCKQAMRVASPTKPPYCIDLVDFKVLNELEIAKRKGGFRLPETVQDRVADDEWAAHYGRDPTEDDES
jgi:hypothetical protein